MTQPFASVIIDTYNYEHFIEAAIDSVLSQDFPADRMEVLVIDDGSTDDTADRVKKYGSKIQYFRKENGGQASAFNFGFSHSRGDIICFLDADDYWLPNKLRRVVEAFENGPAGMVSNDYELSAPDSNGNVKSNMDLVSGDLSSNLELLLRHRIFPTSCLAFRRETLNRLLPAPEAIRLQADVFLALLAAFVAPIAALPEILTIYRIHGKNLYTVAQKTAESQRRDDLMRRVIHSEMRVWLRRNGFDPRTRAIRTFLDQWELYRQVIEFSVIPPTRLRLFSHILQYNRTYRGRQNWKLTVLNYFSAVAALVRGHKQPKARMIPSEGIRRG